MTPSAVSMPLEPLKNFLPAQSSVDGPSKPAEFNLASTIANCPLDHGRKHRGKQQTQKLGKLDLWE